MELDEPFYIVVDLPDLAELKGIGADHNVVIEESTDSSELPFAPEAAAIAVVVGAAAGLAKALSPIVIELLKRGRHDLTVKRGDDELILTNVTREEIESILKNGSWKCLDVKKR